MDSKNILLEFTESETGHNKVTEKLKESFMSNSVSYSIVNVIATIS